MLTEKYFFITYMKLLGASFYQLLLRASIGTEEKARLEFSFNTPADVSNRGIPIWPSHHNRKLCRELEEGDKQIRLDHRFWWWLASTIDSYSAQILLVISVLYLVG